jgi:hypothetical protein
MPQANSMEVQAVTAKRSVIGRVWRWRTEMITAMLLAYSAGALDAMIGLAGVLAVAGGSLAGCGLVPCNRRFVVRRFWCVVTRHRLQTVFWELRFHTRAFRLPLVLWVRPTPVGERAWVLLRAGLCPADFGNSTDEIATACSVRDCRVTGSRRMKSLVTIDVIRRDLLAPGKVIPSRLPAGPGGEVPVPEWLALPDENEVPGPVVRAAERGWPDIAPDGEDR